MIVCTTFHGNPCKSCWDISLWTRLVDWHITSRAEPSPLTGSYKFPPSCLFSPKLYIIKMTNGTDENCTDKSLWATILLSFLSPSSSPALPRFLFITAATGSAPHQWGGNIHLWHTYSTGRNAVVSNMFGLGLWRWKLQYYAENTDDGTMYPCEMFLIIWAYSAPICMDSPTPAASWNFSCLTDGHQIVWQQWHSWQSRRQKTHKYNGGRAQKNTHEQAGSLTMSKADRLCENEKRKIEWGISNNGREKYSRVHRVRVTERESQLVTDVHALAFPSRSAPGVQM